jgi:beta-lactam-binding protein with PASTA domain
MMLALCADAEAATVSVGSPLTVDFSGRSTGATAKTGKIRKQSPKPGKILASGSKVAVTLKP